MTVDLPHPTRTPADPGTTPKAGPSKAPSSRDAGLVAHRAVIAHLEACGEAMFAAEEGDERGEMDSPAVGPYCGCDDCYARKALAVAWPILLADAAVHE